MATTDPTISASAPDEELSAPGPLPAAGADDAANNARLLAALTGVPPPRRARYRAVIVLVRGADDPAPLVAEGCWEGRIALAPRGHLGFGYDPLFLVGDDERTAAELAPEVKNRLSHRGQALRSLLRPPVRHSSILPKRIQPHCLSMLRKCFSAWRVRWRPSSINSSARWNS